MVLARFQRTIVDEAGNVLPGATVTVRRETSGAPLAVLYSDRAGTLANVANPLTTGSDGLAAFYVAGGAYRIDVSSSNGNFTQTLRYVGVGLAQETDGTVAGVALAFDSAVADADPGAGQFRLNNATPASASQAFISTTDADGNDISALLATLDDGGSSGNRGTLVLRSASAVSFVATVTGSVTSASGYVKVPVTVLAANAAADFVDGAEFGLVFQGRGTDGTGNVAVSGLSNVGDNVALFGASDGTTLKDSGSRLTGRQTIWIPAGAMVPLTTSGPEQVTLRPGFVAFAGLRFDPSTAEFASFAFKAPKGWNESTIQAQILWMTETTAAGNVVWSVGGGAFSHGSSLNVDVGVSNQSVTSAAPNDAYNMVDTGELPTITLTDQSPGIMEGDMVSIRVTREANNGSDTLATDATLLGVAIYYNTSKNTDD